MKCKDCNEPPRERVKIPKAQCPVCGRWVRSLWVHVERHAREGGAYFKMPGLGLSR